MFWNQHLLLDACLSFKHLITRCSEWNITFLLQWGEGREKLKVLHPPMVQCLSVMEPNSALLFSPAMLCHRCPSNMLLPQHCCFPCVLVHWILVIWIVFFRYAVLLFSQMDSLLSVFTSASSSATVLTEGKKVRNYSSCYTPCCISLALVIFASFSHCNFHEHVFNS